MVTFLGGMFGMLSDPLVWLLVAICTGFGFGRLPPYLPALIAAAATLITVLVLLSWWAKLGVEPTAERIGMMFLRHSAYAYLAYGAGRLLSNLRLSKNNT